MLLLVIYLAFISLGLPDSVLGSAWPVMHTQLGAAIAQGGVISMVVCAGTICSALLTDRFQRFLGTGKLTLLSVALTAFALYGYAHVSKFYQLMLWAIPYGLGAGAVDASLNAYVATHYEARHMNWLHCMWGVGASLGPVIMGWHIQGTGGWQKGYTTIALLQFAFVVVLAFTLGMWSDTKASKAADSGVLTRQEAIKRAGLAQALIGFFCYCALESSCGLWASTFMVFAKGVSPNQSALFTSLFFIGITIGRALSGFLTLRMDGYQLQHLGEALICVGVILMAIAPAPALIGAGLVLIGLGCAPIYPQMIQLTPTRFGIDAADSLMGLQMAAAYVGSFSFPPLMGLVLEIISPTLFPILTGVLVVVMTFALNSCDSVCARNHS